MKMKIRFLTLVLAVGLILFSGCKKDAKETVSPGAQNPAQAVSNADHSMDNLVPVPTMISNTYTAGTINCSAGVRNLVGKYYYMQNGTNMPLFVIAHAVGRYYDDYDSIAKRLAKRGFF